MKKILLSLLIGIICSLFASGGGILLIPFYIYLFNSSEKEARATTIFCMFPIIILNSIYYGFNYNINLKLLLILIIGSSFGSLIGTKLLHCLNTKYLKLIFIIFLLYSSFKFIFF